MSATNVSLSVPDPDRVIAGESPSFNGIGAFIQLWRFASEDIARAQVEGNLVTLGTLVATFTLIASTETVTEAAGPFRFATYDSAQLSSSWYAYRFTDAAVSAFSLLSDPWQADNPAAITLRDILVGVGELLGGAIEQGTATAGAAGTVTCARMFQSSIRSDDWFKGQYLLITQDAGGSGAAPEGEYALVASVDTATGIATLDRSLTTAPANGDTFVVSLMDPAAMIAAVNRALEKMEVIVSHDIALSRTEDIYSAPQGLRSETQLLSAGVLVQYANTNVDDEGPIVLDLFQEGSRMRFRVPHGILEQRYNLVRLRYLRSYRDLGGRLSTMSDTTEAPLEWIRAAAALEIAMRMVDEDEEEPLFQQWLRDARQAAAVASGKYSPQVVRQIRAGRHGTHLPGPVAQI